MIYLFIITLLLLITFVIYYAVNRKKIQQHIEKVYIEENRQKLLNQLQTEKQFVEDELLLASRRLEEERERIDALIKKGTDDIRFLEMKREQIDRAYQERLAEQENFLSIDRERQLKAIEDVVAERKARVDADVEAYRELETQKARTALDVETQARRAQEEASLKQFLDGLAQCKQGVQDELDRVKAELDDYKQKQQVVNEAILRQRAIDEQQDFYKIKLSDEAKQDIGYLISIINNVKNSTILYKLIWSEYIQKPFNTVLKNVTEGKEIKCVIYKITNINTQEIYIGKTKADVTKRWTEHIKTSLNIGTVAKSKIHEALFKHWDEFTFEILEIVKDEGKLSEREKYYINFYQSNIYGYNMNCGG